MQLPSKQKATKIVTASKTQANTKKEYDPKHISK